ncbi:MAG: endopeptidase La [Pseudomonadota bacterium]
MPAKEPNVKVRPSEIPVLPLRDVVVFPGMVIPLFIGRPKSIRALELAIKDDRRIILVAQQNSSLDEPKEEDLYQIGTLASLLQLLKLPDGTVKILVEGEERVQIKKFIDSDKCLLTNFELLKIEKTDHLKLEAFVRSAISLFGEYVKLNAKIPAEIITLLSSITDENRLSDTIAAHLNLKLHDKQLLLESCDLLERFQRLVSHLEHEINILQLEKRISSRVKDQVKKSQEEYYLTEKMRAIQKEMEDIGNVPNEIDGLKERIEKAGMSVEAKNKATAELNRLKLMPPMSAEATVSRNYLDYLLLLPWKKCSKISRNLKAAEKTLNAEHYGLEKVKEHILEYLAVQNRVQKMKGPILCLVGPPGVGKTSLGKSIAHATGRTFVRMSLGGVRDEAEIRGHRRTYIGSLPGKIIQKLIKAEVRNPLFLLDEIDKMSADFRGDPAAALLEVLDPEQNSTFSDHYLEVDYDLSDVMFVTTANTLDILPALRDRMEIIKLSGYTEDEKLHIAEKHLIPKQLKENGLKKSELIISSNAIIDILRHYTREAGVRSLERAISKICRKVVRKLADSQSKKLTILPSDLEDYLGVPRYRFGKAEIENQIGQVTGLAWTELGGELLTIEVAAVTGKGKIQTTGQLGNVMKESIHAAVTVVRTRASQLGISLKYFDKHDLHIHLPEGAIPKDGPSAGAGVCLAIVSVLTGIPVHAHVAMTGEITLRGEVLPIGGLKEKLLAARRGGITDVIIPNENIKDLKEIPDNVKADLKIHPVRWIDQIFEIALEKLPIPLTGSSEEKPVLTSHRRARDTVNKSTGRKTH